MTQDKRIPVSLVTGFLGSGKTTLLSHLLTQPGMERVAVIVNEFGDGTLDHQLISGLSEDVVLLSNGCLCCAYRGALAGTLDGLLQRTRNSEIPRFSRIVVETSGLADPVPAIETLVRDPETSSSFRLGGVITTVDASRAESYLERHKEAVRQVTAADLLLLTKTDLVSPIATESLMHHLAELNGEAKRIFVTNGKCDASRLFGVKPAYNAAPAMANYSFSNAGAPIMSPRAPADRTEIHAGHHSTKLHDVSGSTIRALKLRYRSPIQPQGLILWMDLMAAFWGPRLLRVKGLANVAGSPTVIHGMGQLFHPPAKLKSWPSDDRSSYFIFVTEGLEQREIENTFRAFEYSSATDRATPRGYGEFLELIPAFR